MSLISWFEEHRTEMERRVRLEFRIELPLLKARWKQILFGAIFQYVHAMSTQLAHRMHQPQEEPLGDVGFKYLPELGLENAWMSETIFWCLFLPFIFWSFSPFVTQRKRFYTAVMYARLLMVLTACQALRIVSFTVTQLPAPNYHCREGEATAVREMPSAWWGHVAVDLGRQATHGCGDLIFSSHTTFVLVGVLTFTEYGETLVLKVIAWVGVAIMGLCIVASRKHYSVDVVVAWYTVPLVFYAMHRRWTTKRPVQDYWPHRPLVGEEAAAAEAAEASALEDSKGEDFVGGKPLLPVVVVGQHSRQGSVSGLGLGHSRQGSRGAGSTTDLRILLGKPPLVPVKEPASPPPEAAPIGPMMPRNGRAASTGVVRTRQGSSAGGGLGMEIELRDVERGDMDGSSSMGGDSPSAQQHLHGGSSSSGVRGQRDGSPPLMAGVAAARQNSGAPAATGQQCRIL